MKRRLALACLLLLVAGCTTLPPPEARPVQPDSAARLRRARAAVERGDSAGARSLLEDDTASVDAVRLLQNLRVASGEGWEVYEEAATRRDENPQDPAALYLLGRVIPDRAVQESQFRRALALDPSFFYANYGLAVILLDGGDAAGAATFASRAAVIRPDDVACRVVLARALGEQGRREEALAILLSTQRLDPDDPWPVLEAAGVLLDDGRNEAALDMLLGAVGRRPGSRALLAAVTETLEGARVGERALRRAESAADAAVEKLGPDATALRLRARVRRLLGRPGEALADLDAAVAAGALRASLREERLAAAFDAGAWDRARAVWEGSLPLARLADPRNRRAPAVAELSRALDAASRAPRDPDALVGLARALSGTGFSGPAALVSTRALALSPDRSDLQKLAAEFAAWDRFVKVLREEILIGYRRFRQGEAVDDLDTVLARLSELSRRNLGTDVVEGLEIDRYPFVGAVARTDTEDTDADAAVSEWEKHGLLLVVGQRVAGPVEGKLLRILGLYRNVEEEGITYDLALGEGRLLPAFAEVGGGEIAGFAQPGWMSVNLLVVARWEEELRALARRAEERPLWPATDDDRRRSLWFPNGLRARLARNYVTSAEFGNAAPEGGTLASTMAHERGHLHDAERFLPLSEHLLTVLYEVVRHGFRAGRIEITLERRAEAWSLRRSPYPWNALANTVAFLPDRFSSPPHSIAYGDLVESLVDEIADHPEQYPSIDRRYNILQQLDRLSGDELARLLGREAVATPAN